MRLFPPMEHALRQLHRESAQLYGELIAEKLRITYIGTMGDYMLFTLPSPCPTTIAANSLEQAKEKYRLTMEKYERAAS